MRACAHGAMMIRRLPLAVANVKGEGRAATSVATEKGRTGASAPLPGWAPLRRQTRDSQLLARLLSMPEIKLSLLIEPTLGRGIKRNRKPNGHFGADARAAIQDRGKRLAAHP